MATEKRAPVSKSVVMEAIKAGSAEKLTADKVAENLGMTKASFVQAMNALRKEHKSLRANGVQLPDFPALADGRSARKGQTNSGTNVAASAILAALGQVGQVEPESTEVESTEQVVTEEVAETETETVAE